MSEMDWRIYYHDGSTFDPTDGEWANAPREGVQIIILPDPNCGRRWLCGSDYYLMAPDDVAPVEANDLPSQLVRWGIEPPTPFPDQNHVRGLLADFGVLSFVKFGMALPVEEYTEIVRVAKQDPDFPTAFSPLPGDQGDATRQGPI